MPVFPHSAEQMAAQTADPVIRAAEAQVQIFAVHGNRHGGLVVGQKPNTGLLGLDGVVVAFWEHGHTFFR